jgi:hypothetical protein
MVNGEWKDERARNDKWFTFARQINDFETHTYATTETTSLFSSNLLLKFKYNTRK